MDTICVCYTKSNGWEVLASDTSFPCESEVNALSTAIGLQNVIRTLFNVMCPIILTYKGEM